MRIDRPTYHPDLLIVYDIVTELEAKHLMTLPNETDDIGREKISQAAASVERKILEVIKSEYPDLVVDKTISQGGGICFEPGHFLKQHVDGPGDVDRPGHGIDSVSTIAYLNDDYEGGEIYYSELDFVYKPVARSAVFHRGENPFMHGVLELLSGKRWSYELFSYEKYDPEEVIAQIEERHRSEANQYN